MKNLQPIRRDSKYYLISIIFSNNPWHGCNILKHLLWHTVLEDRGTVMIK